MKVIFVFLLVSISSIVISQNRYHVDNTTYLFYYDDTVVKSKHDMKPINGVLYCDYGDIGIYVDGKNHDGFKRRWYRNGQLYYEYNLKDGKKDGLGKAWHKNGQLKAEVNFKDGKKDGLCIQWYKNGQLFNVAIYKDGEVDGLMRVWNRNGQLSQEKIFDHGKLVSGKCWDKEGNEMECL